MSRAEIMQAVDRVKAADEAIEAARGDAAALATIANDAYIAAERFTLEKLIQAGKALLAAKDCTTHGAWKDWLAENWRQSPRSAQVCMQVANHWLGLSSKAQRAAFLDCSSVRQALETIQPAKAAPSRPAEPKTIDIPAEVRDATPARAQVRPAGPQREPTASYVGLLGRCPKCKIEVPLTDGQFVRAHADPDGDPASPGECKGAGKHVPISARRTVLPPPAPAVRPLPGAEGLSVHAASGVVAPTAKFLPAHAPAHAPVALPPARRIEEELAEEDGDDRVSDELDERAQELAAELAMQREDLDRDPTDPSAIGVLLFEGGMGRPCRKGALGIEVLHEQHVLHMLCEAHDHAAYKVSRRHYTPTGLAGMERVVEKLADLIDEAKKVTLKAWRAHPRPHASGGGLS